jgi:mannan endo-1,4-beta-mannosidase
MYPGDEYVDIIGVDVYAPDNEMLKKLIIDGSLWATELSAKRGKIAALTEVGIRKGLKNSVGNDWFMSGFLNLFKNDPSIHLAYMLTWRNNDPDHYWVPLAGQPNYNSFIQFYKDPYTLFLKDIKDVYSK